MRRYELSLTDLNELVRLLTTDGLFLPDPELIPVCRDPRDDVCVALAVAARADLLVTRDDDLKSDTVVRDYLASHSVVVVTVREFTELLRS